MRCASSRGVSATRLLFEIHVGKGLPVPSLRKRCCIVAQQVEKVEGNTLQVKYKDGEKTIVVPKDAEVVNLVAGSKADLKTGAHVFIPRWEKQGDGTWQATVVVVGRDGITPPM